MAMRADHRNDSALCPTFINRFSMTFSQQGLRDDSSRPDYYIIDSNRPTTRTINTDILLAYRATSNLDVNFCIMRGTLNDSQRQVELLIIRLTLQ